MFNPSALAVLTEQHQQQPRRVLFLTSLDPGLWWIILNLLFNVLIKSVAINTHLSQTRMLYRMGREGKSSTALGEGCESEQSWAAAKWETQTQRSAFSRNSAVGQGLETQCTLRNPHLPPSICAAPLQYPHFQVHIMDTSEAEVMREVVFTG